jgi:polar amino acid transport system substrate-binding protein
VLNELIRNGKYADALKVWNLESEGIETSQITPPGLPKS